MSGTRSLHADASALCLAWGCPERISEDEYDARSGREMSNDVGEGLRPEERGRETRGAESGWSKPNPIQPLHCRFLVGLFRPIVENVDGNDGDCFVTTDSPTLDYL